MAFSLSPKVLKILGVVAAVSVIGGVTAYALTSSSRAKAVDTNFVAASVSFSSKSSVASSIASSISSSSTPFSAAVISLSTNSAATSQAQQANSPIPNAPTSAATTSTNTNPNPAPASQNPTPSSQAGNEAGKTTVQVFFGDENQSGTNCGATVAVERELNTSESVARGALMELFKGPSEAEKAKGLYSGFAGWGEVFNSINLKNDGTLQVDLKGAVLPQTSGQVSDKYGWGTKGTSCGSGQMQQIRKTLKQFPTVKYVIFSVEGELKSPDNFYGCPSSGEANPGNFEASAWTELQKQCGL